MTGYVLRPAGPAAVSTVTAICLLGVLSTIVRGDEIPVFFLHLVVLVLVSGAAYLLDDEAKQVTDVVPASLLRRRAIHVLTGFSVLAVGWAVLAGLLQWWAPPTPLAALAWESAGLACLAVAASAVVARHGETEPGNVVASAGALIFVGVLIAQPLLHVTWLVSGPDEPARGGWWTAAIVAAAFTFVISSRDRHGAATGATHHSAGPSSARHCHLRARPSASRVKGAKS